MSVMVVELYQALRSAGVEEVAASSAARAVLAELVTKGDLALELTNVRAEMKSGFAEVRAEMKSGFAEVRAEMSGAVSDLRAEMRGGFAEMRAEIAASKSDLLRWHTGTLITVTAIYGGLVAALRLWA